jgi:hypothetical protein
MSKNDRSIQQAQTGDQTGHFRKCPKEFLVIYYFSLPLVGHDREVF